MADRTRVASPPARPLVVFDGDCAFCRFWIERWRWRTGGLVDYEPFQQPDILQRFPEIPREHYRAAVHLIEPGGRVSRGAEAAARLLAGAGRSLLLRIYEQLPAAGALMEWAYRAIATHRGFAGRITTWLWGKNPRPPMYAATSWLFLRLLGVVYLAAFWSLLVQIGGLIGHNGILPADAFMDDVRRFADERGMGPLARFHALPTMTWLAASDAFLCGLCLAGLGCAILLIAGVWEVVAVPFLWLTYLTFSIVGQDFLSFQWDTLLLESGFLAILLARGFKRTRLRDAIEPPRLAIWLFLWLVFRLLVGSGGVKLASGDPTWRGLTALDVHFETQPIPTPVGWFAHRLPEWFLKGSTAAVLGIELAVPLLIVFPRRARAAAFICLVTLQALIALTGNYAFFNLLSATLCLFLLDDATVSRFLRAAPAPQRSAQLPGRRVFTTAAAIVIIPVSTLVFAISLRFRIPGWPLIVPLAAAIEPFRSVNNYGLFAVMTTTRPEIVVEGSNDGATWLAYEFRYKPGDLRRRPPWVAPHQPRLDWQMWFAALSRFDQERWFGAFCARLLEGSPEVLRLLEQDPFHGVPPRYVRAVVYDYHFSTNAVRRLDGVWWTRDRQRDYSPVLSLNPAGSRK